MHPCFTVVDYFTMYMYGWVGGWWWLSKTKRLNTLTMRYSTMGSAPKHSHQNGKSKLDESVAEVQASL